ncbi:hypothetical protein ACFLRF_04290 [Candidatus Altiarchaeota archaeon]
MPTRIMKARIKDGRVTATEIKPSDLQLYEDLEDRHRPRMLSFKRRGRTLPSEKAALEEVGRTGATLYYLRSDESEQVIELKPKQGETPLDDAEVKAVRILEGLLEDNNSQSKDLAGTLAREGSMSSWESQMRGQGVDAAIRFSHDLEKWQPNVTGKLQEDEVGRASDLFWDLNRIALGRIGGRLETPIIPSLHAKGILVKDSLEIIPGLNPPRGLNGLDTMLAGKTDEEIDASFPDTEAQVKRQIGVMIEGLDKSSVTSREGGLLMDNAQALAGYYASKWKTLNHVFRKTGEGPEFLQAFTGLRPEVVPHYSYTSETSWSGMVPRIIMNPVVDTIDSGLRKNLRSAVIGRNLADSIPETMGYLLDEIPSPPKGVDYAVTLERLDIASRNLKAFAQLAKAWYTDR